MLTQPLINFCGYASKPVDAVLTASNDDDGGETANNAHTNKTSKTNHPPRAFNDAASRNEDDDSDNSLELVSENCNRVAERIHEAGLTDRRAEFFSGAR